MPGSLNPVFLLLSMLVLAGCSPPAPPPQPLRSVRTQAVVRSPAASSHEFAAEIRARHETRLGFRVAGKVTARHIELGQPVKAGQLLAELDPQDLRLAAEAAQAAVLSAQVSAEQSASDFERFRHLRAQGFISEAELQRRESVLRSAQALLAQARAQAGVQVNQSGYSRLLAPADGVVTDVLAERASVVQAGQPVLTLAMSGPRDAVFHVPEDRVEAVRALLGRKGAIEVRLWGQQAALAATVREVAAATDAATRTFQVKAGLEGGGVELGRTAVVAMPGVNTDSRVHLPLPALFTQAGRTLVWVLDAGSMTVRAQAVEVAGADGNQALLLSGLEDGAEVVTAGVHVLSEGQKVTRYVAPGAAARLVTPAASVSTH